jgi:hypothetical protein
MIILLILTRFMFKSLTMSPLKTQKEKVGNLQPSPFYDFLVEFIRHQEVCCR